MSRVAVVTGGASGIGLGIVRRFAGAGYRVALFDLHEDSVARAAEEHQASGHVVDVGDRAQVDAAIEAVRAELGPIEIMVTSAGIDTTGPFTDITVDDWERALRVNLTGTFHCIQAAVPDMLAGGWGRIVTISSSSAQSGAPNRAHYVASKGGVIALTKALAAELSPHGITANTIPPSVVDTPMAQAGVAAGEVPPLDQIAGFIPVRRVSTPDDIAAACAFLCSDDAETITGQVIGVNGGMYI